MFFLSDRDHKCQYAKIYTLKQSFKPQFHGKYYVSEVCVVFISWCCSFCFPDFWKQVKVRNKEFATHFLWNAHFNYQEFDFNPVPLFTPVVIGSQHHNSPTVVFGPCCKFVYSVVSLSPWSCRSQWWWLLLSSKQAGALYFTQFSNYLTWCSSIFLLDNIRILERAAVRLSAHRLSWKYLCSLRSPVCTHSQLALLSISFKNLPYIADDSYLVIYRVQEDAMKDVNQLYGYKH